MRGIVLVIYSMACCAAQHTCSCTPCTDDCPPDRTSTFTCQDSSADMQAAHAMNHFSEVIDRLHLSVYLIPNSHSFIYSGPYSS